MLNFAFINDLHCPYCWSPLSIETTIAGDVQGIECAILRCECYRYPVIDGIAILKQQSGPADTRDARVACLDRRDVDGARRCAMQASAGSYSGISGLHRVLAGLTKQGIPLATELARAACRRPGRAGAGASPSFQKLLSDLRPGLYGEYRYHRYVNNSFHASIPLLLLLGDIASRPTRPRVLELTCGIGHSAFLISTLFPHLDLVATDHDFANLLIARRHFAPRAKLVCIDAEVPLPFKSASFAAVFCLDGFHYLRSKAALCQELDRIAENDALHLFAHLHNRLKDNIHPGIPLSARGYQRCLNGVACKLFDEASVLEDFVQEGTLRLDRDHTEEQLDRARSFGLVATRRSGYWRARSGLEGRLAENPSEVMPNPLYRVERRNTRLVLTANWPSAELERECQQIKRYLPDVLRLDGPLLRTLDGGEAGTDAAAALNRLVRSFALVRLPRQAYLQATDTRSSTRSMTEAETQ